MVYIALNDAQMIITVKGMHKLWALKSKMTIPLEHISGTRVNNKEIVKPQGWRAPGTYIPGIITAGTYRSKGNKIFWDVVNLKNSIIIDLKNNEYKQLILEVSDRETAVKNINHKISST